MRPQLREIIILVCVAQAGISLLGEVNLVRDLVDNQRSCGAKIAGFDLKADRCVILRHNDSYHHLTKDRDPRPH